MAKKKSRKVRNTLVALILVAVVGGTVATILLRKREIVITVQTERVTRHNLTETVVATGHIQPVTKVTINPEVSGEIVELPVKDGQTVKKGDLLLRIKPDNYVAALNSAKANYKSSLASQNVSAANLQKADVDFKRAQELHKASLVSDADLLVAQTAYDVAKASYESSIQQVAQSSATVARAEEDLNKTTIVAPMDGTVTQLKSERGERVVGTGMMAGTEIMTVADLSEMEARVDLGEVDVVLVKIGEKARLDVDAFRDKKFSGTVTEIANAANSTGVGTQAEATKFQVKIRVAESAGFRPGMSVTAYIETRYRTNVLTVPIQSVTTRFPGGETNAPAAMASPARENADAGERPAARTPQNKPDEVVFLAREGKAVMQKVKRGISDDNYTEIIEGVKEGDEVVSGGYKAINRELKDGSKIKVGPAASEKEEKDKTST
jgi:HlyD family secretion protein